MGMWITSSKSSRVRANLNHPVIDADGHQLEFLPALDEHLRLHMGEGLFAQWLAKESASFSCLSDRESTRRAQTGWWTATPATQPYDRAAAALPRLLQHRMDSLGIDFTILYTSVGLRAMVEPNDAIRIEFCRAYNQFLADRFLEYQDRLTPAALIPMFSPKEAVEEIDHCRSLGLKVAHLAHGVPRPVAAVHHTHPELFPMVYWLDTYGLDSAFDYDPVWSRLAAAGFAATFHGHSTHAAAAKPSRSISNYAFNHIGAHASLMAEVCKSLIFGGVTRRFGALPFAFLEGGVHWASGLVADFTEHWKKRNVSAISSYDPRRLDLQLMQELLRTWGEGFTQSERPHIDWFYANRREGPNGDSSEPDQLDDFRACALREEADIPILFRNLYFGTEGDDRAIVGAINGQGSSGIALNPMFSTDYGHWDNDMPDELLAHSYTLVENDLLTDQQFRSFTADNVIRLHGSLNPEFWRGTSVEPYANTLLNSALRRNS